MNSDSKMTVTAGLMPFVAKRLMYCWVIVTHLDGSQTCGRIEDSTFEHVAIALQPTPHEARTAEPPRSIPWNDVAEVEVR